jgi:SOS-response transcriptional repressor LexA
MMKVQPSRIQERLDTLNISAAEAERRSKNYRGMINQILAEKARMPAADRMARLAAALEADVDYLLGMQPTPSKSASKPQSVQTEPFSYAQLPEMPVIGLAGAGAFIAADEDVDEPVTVQGNRHPKFPKANHFAVEVKGDSMNDMGSDSLFSGDIAFAVAWGDTGYAPRNGYLVIVEQRINGGHIRERTVKEIRESKDGIELIPRSTNPRHKPIFVPWAESDDGTEIEIIGLVYGVNRVFQRRI